MDNGFSSKFHELARRYTPEEVCQAERSKRFDKNKKDDVINPIVNNINKDFVVGEL